MRAVVLASLVVVVSCQLFNKEFNTEWHDFVGDQKKLYLNHPEEIKRRLIFDANLEKIAKHNKEYEQGLHSYHLASNQFADMTGEEFISRYGSDFFPPKLEGIPFKSKKTSVPDTFDWRDHNNVVTPVKQQGTCDSCWAFAAIGSLESAHAIAHNELLTLSEQQLVDCTRYFGQCGPYEVALAFDYVIDVGGVSTERSYPYVGYEQHCDFKPKNIAARMSYYEFFLDEDTIKEAVATEGPVALGIFTDLYRSSNNSAVYKSQFYSDGVIDDNCIVPYGGHYVTAVGYGIEGGKDYWLAKNSWGTSWGVGGYCKIIRNVNHCDMLRATLIPIL